MSFLKSGKKFTSCTLNCGERATGECKKRHNCGLSLPSDNLLIQQLKQCMIRGGLDTNGLRQICFCLAGAGARQLSPNVCSRLTIT
ncbi:hypothetical protein OESDEN_05684 [Oesophagostomum dentatum]|uniref:Uncharacterized protein n=1 Tax=Oesophagostomum dentatum TaxID=61180 RepID=A0A0B1TG47_OESDE|nr:hypothetical protein OESDEN_05684 [Oesophagostomum dentatum]